VQLTQNIKGFSKLAVILLILISFLLGAILSYIWTMGYYAPNEFNLPNQTSVTIEGMPAFFAENATYFNITVLNPSYSPTEAKIELIKAITGDGKVHIIDSTSPPLPLTLAPGKSQIIQSFWNWGNYTGQTIDVYVLIADGSGPAVQVKTAFMNLTVSSVILEPAVTSSRFNVTVESMSSPVSVDISNIFVNGVEITGVTPTLPYSLSPNTAATFTLNRDWKNLQNQPVSVMVQTKQGYVAYGSTVGPQVKLNFSNIVFFNTTETSFYFNMIIQNAGTPPAKQDIDLITLNVGGQTILIGIGDVVPPLPQTIEPDTSLPFTCTWNWSSHQSENATITVYTVQGFTATSAETTIPSIPQPS